MNRDAMASRIPPFARNVLRILTIAIAAGLLAACSDPDATANGGDAAAMGDPPLAGADIGGPFELTAADGRTVRWSDFDGRYRIVYFGYAYCPDICPTDVQRMSQGLTLFERDAPDRAAQVQPIFITIDPERDTPAVVGEFASAFHKRLIGLTGTPEQVKAAADAFRVYYEKGAVQPGGGYLMQHSNITYLFGPEGQPLATLPTDQGAEAVKAELDRWVR